MTRLIPHGPYKTLKIDGLLLLFHPASGATHVLDSPMPEILELLEIDGCDMSLLAHRLCEQLGVECDDEARSVTAARVAELIEIGLVRSI